MRIKQVNGEEMNYSFPLREIVIALLKTEKYFNTNKKRYKFSRAVSFYFHETKSKPSYIIFFCFPCLVMSFGSLSKKERKKNIALTKNQEI